VTPALAVDVARPTGAVATLTIRRPPVNAIDSAGYDALTAALEVLAGEPAVRAVVLTGDGERVFSAGTDLRDFDTETATERVAAAALGYFERLAAMPQPVVGALNGPAVGAGAMTAAACDLLVGTRATYFLVPEVPSGFPGGASHVKRLAPWFKVQRMMLLGERLTAEEALAHGTLAEVVERAEDVLPAALRWAERLAALDPAAVGPARRILRAPEDAVTLDGYRRELEALALVLAERRGGAPEPAA
jgi:enoyl-CoA hydratase